MPWTPAGNLKGPKGDQGDQGEPGATWISGTANPTSGIGVIGDFYLNTSTYAYYKKTNSTTWTVQGNLRGAQGLQGIQGIQGIQGNPGADGAKGDKGDNVLVWTGTAAQYVSVNKNTYDLYLVKA